MRWKVVLVIIFYVFLYSCKEKKIHVEQQSVLKENISTNTEVSDVNKTDSTGKEVVIDKEAVVEVDSLISSTSDTVRIEDFRIKQQLGNLTVAYNSEPHYAPSEVHIFDKGNFVKSVDLSQFGQYQFRKKVNTKEGTSAYFTKDSTEHLEEYFSEREIAIARPWETNRYKYNYVDESIQIIGENIVYTTYIGIGDSPKNAEGHHPENCKVVITSFDGNGELIYKEKIIAGSNPVFSSNVRFALEMFSKKGYDTSSECFRVIDIQNEQIVESICSKDFSNSYAYWVSPNQYTYLLGDDIKSNNKKNNKIFFHNIARDKRDSIISIKDNCFFNKGSWFHYNRSDETPSIIQK